MTMWVTHRCEQAECAAPSRVIMVEDGNTLPAATTAELDQKRAAHNACWHPQMSLAPFTTRPGRWARAAALLLTVGGAVVTGGLLALLTDLGGLLPAIPDSRTSWAYLMLTAAAFLTAWGLRILGRAHEWRVYDRRHR